MKSKVKDLRLSIKQDNKQIKENQTPKINSEYVCISCKVYQDKLKKMNEEINDKDIIIAKSNNKLDILKSDIKTYLEQINKLELELMNQKKINNGLKKLLDENEESNIKNLNNKNNLFKDEIKRENEELKMEITNLSNQLGDQKLLEEMLKHQIHKFKEYMIENC